MPSIRQRFHLSPCSDFRSHFSCVGSSNNRNLPQSVKGGPCYRVRLWSRPLLPQPLLAQVVPAVRLHQLEPEVVGAPLVLFRRLPVTGRSLWGEGTMLRQAELL